jgi:hypothetical protein
MRIRCLTLAILLAGALGLQAQTADEIYQIDLIPSGQTFSVGKPVLEGDSYVFRSFPERATTRIRETRVRQITPRKTNQPLGTFYQINLIPSGSVIAKDFPKTRGTMVVFHKYPSGELVSMRRSDVGKVAQIPAATAQATDLAQAVIPIGNLAMQGGSSQAGPQNARTVSAPKGPELGQGFYGNLVPGASIGMPNSANDYQVGRTFAAPPSNAVQSSPGAPPTAPAQTDGQSPPQ